MQPDQPGLEAVPSSDAPEVDQTRRPWGPIERSSSQSKPEHYIPQSPPPSQTIQEKVDVRGYYGQAPPYEAEPQQHHNATEKKSRICGLRRVIFLWVMAGVLLLVVVAVVLGAVLGTVLKSSSDTDSPTDSPSPSTNNTGSSLAILPESGAAAYFMPNSTTLYAYYQDAQGRIVEDQRMGSDWALSSSDVPQHAVVATDAQSGSPLAAISWAQFGTTVRQVFYLDGNDRVMTTNTTEDNGWSEPTSILTGDTAAPGTKALTASVGTENPNEGLDGIRVFYGSSNKQIQICGMDFWESNEPIWHMWDEFDGSDELSGAAVVTKNSVDYLYMRNTTKGFIQLWTWDYYDQYANGGGGWKSGTDVGTSVGDAFGPDIPSGADIAAATDGDSTNFVFYQDADGNVIRALEYGQGFGDYLDLATAAGDSQLTATYDPSESSRSALVMYHEEGTDTSVAYLQVDRSGATVNSGTVEKRR